MKANVIMTLTAAMALTAGAETYTLKGERYLRKYTAPQETPVYNAEIDAATVVRDFCDVPWTRSDVTEATSTFHDTEALDLNVAARDRFDAALFCAGHTNGVHRAYANAAVYRFKLPSGQLPKMTGLAVNVYSDPYNANGARIVLMTNDSGVIPSDCATVRGDVEGGIRQTGVVRRVTRVSGGKDYWYPATSNVVFSADSLGDQGISLGRYLYVFVLLENYSTTRGNWLEGCSYIENAVRITTSGPVPGWTDGSTVDLSNPDGSQARVANIKVALICNEDYYKDFKSTVIVEQYPELEPAASITGRGTVSNAVFAARSIGKFSVDADANTEYEFVADISGVRNVKSRLTAYIDDNNNGSFDPGEPFGYSSDIDPSDGKIIDMEMRSTHPVFGRVKLRNAVENDRNSVFGEYANVRRIDTQGDHNLSRMTRVRIDYYAVNDRKVGVDMSCEVLLLYNRVLMDKWFDLRYRDYISESDLIGEGNFDINWQHMDEIIDDAAVLLKFGGEVESVTYRVVIDDEEFIHPTATNDVLSVAFVRSYDNTAKRKRAEHLRDMDVADEQRLAWSLGANDTYTAARIQFATVSGSSTNTVYNGPAFMANVRRRIGNDLFYTCAVPDGIQPGNYVWRVTALNAKFKTDYFSDYSAVTIR